MTYDVYKIFGILDSPLPLVRISRNLSVLSVRKIWQFLNPPSPLRVDVICTWSLSLHTFLDIQKDLTKFCSNVQLQWNTEQKRIVGQSTGLPIWSVKTFCRLGYAILSGHKGNR